MRSMYDVVKRPIISEKSTFNVKVSKVHTMIMQGKMKRAGRFETKRSNWKKALVTLAEGQKIDFFQAK
jgi:large subunit ribosomal protein L23